MSTDQAVAPKRTGAIRYRLVTMGVIVRSLLALVVAVLVALGDANPSLADDVADCKADNAELGIAGCSKLLQRKGLSARDRAAVLARRGYLYSGNGRVDETFADGARAIEADRNYTGGYYTRGLALLMKRDFDRAVADFNRATQIDPKFVWSYYGRGAAYRHLGQFERAIAELNRAVALDSKQSAIFNDRGLTYGLKGEIERSLADFRRAIELNPKNATAVANRGWLYGRKGEFERGLAEVARAIELSPKLAGAHAAAGVIQVYQGAYDQAIVTLARAIDLDPRQGTAYSARGRALVMKGEIDRGSADTERSIEIDPLQATAYTTRGMIALRRNDPDRALAAFLKAIEIDQSSAEPYAMRAEVYLQRNQWPLAIADLRKVLSLPARTPLERNAQIKAAETLTSLVQKADSTPTVAVTTTPSVTPPPSKLPAVTAVPATGRRIALVIGNSAYTHAGALKNPINDARAIATLMRRIGFTEITERYDLGLAQMTAALKDFGDGAASADWAVIYFAGHGLEMGGAAYLLPTDAKLERDAHIPYETVPLDRMLQTTESAKKLRLVILDACRNNPFVVRMARTGTGTRSIGRGLPAIEVEGDVLVAYATKHGTTALDGDGDNSPFALALAQHMPVPNVDIRVMFGRVRDAVRRATNNQQEPYTYGSIGGDLHYFVAAR